MMLKTVSTVADVREGIVAYHSAIGGSAYLRRVAIHTHWWFCCRVDGRWLFGPSKFVGYKGITPEAYETHGGGGGTLHGRQTQVVLESLFEQVDPASALHRDLRAELAAFLAGHGCRIGGKFKGLFIDPADMAGVPPAIGRDEATLLARIVSDPEICGGRPCIRGTRVRIVDIMEMLAGGMTPREITVDFPYLTLEDVTAALVYGARAVDHAVLRAA